jgi:hypothetical protein
LSKTRESHLIVAALIATATSAAAFTLVGGYKSGQDSNKGAAILAKKKAVFIVFVILDVISMVIFIFVVFIHFFILLIQGLEMDKDETIDKETTRILFEVATWLTMIGMGTMIITLVTGTYAVLVPSLRLAFSTYLIGRTSSSLCT